MLVTAGNTIAFPKKQAHRKVCCRGRYFDESLVAVEVASRCLEALRLHIELEFPSNESVAPTGITPPYQLDEAKTKQDIFFFKYIFNNLL